MILVTDELLEGLREKRQEIAKLNKQVRNLKVKIEKESAKNVKIQAINLDKIGKIGTHYYF